MWKLLLSAILWGVLTFTLGHPWQFGDTSLPPLGEFFSPWSGFWRNAESNQGEFSNHDIVLSGVCGEIQVVFDDRMVPHIFAQNDLDAYYAQGYVTAMHRLWQMDLAARAAAGELSNIFRIRTLEYDKRQRIMGMGYAAENALKGWEKYPEDMAILNAYAAGINAYISSLSSTEYPVEYKLLDYAPEPWTPLKSAYFFKSMAARLCLADDDLEHSMLLKWLGSERFSALFPEHNPNDDPVIPSGTQWNFESVQISQDAEQEFDFLPSESKSEPRKDHYDGSNNWAISGTRTKSGKPILCNDPHLGLSLPSVWYELQIVTPEQNAYGVSLPGMPGVIIGFNEFIAWGETNVGQDVLDWYQIEWVDSTHSEYMLDGKRVPVEYRIEEIAVRDGDTVFDTVSYTIWGPVQKFGPHKGLAMRWLAHEMANEREASIFVQLNHAKSYEDYASILTQYKSPAQNFVFADKEGNIAMHIGGILPLRHNRNGRFVQDGARTVNGWNGFVPAGQNPSVLNPLRGFVSSANQESTDTTYPYIYHGYFEEFRGRMLNRLLRGIEQSEPKDMMALQNNTISLKAEEILPRLLNAVSFGDGEEKQHWDILSAWKYDYEPGSSAPVLFELWYKAFYEALWDDFQIMEDSIYIYAPDAWRTILLIESDPTSPEFDMVSTTAVESFQDIARMSFMQALVAYDKLDSSQKQWGSYRETTIRHLAQIPAFSHTLTAAPGHGDALNATTRTHGPSWRMIVHLTEPIEAYVVYPGGQSGNPGSRFYDTMINAWEKGEYYKVKYLKSPEALEPTLILNIKPQIQ